MPLTASLRIGWDHARDRLLIRWRAWWYNKIPISVTVMLLLLDGATASVNAFVALLLVIFTVCAIGNYGYALNDLYDIDEDRRAQRGNAAASLGRKRVARIIFASAIIAVASSWCIGGLLATGLTFIELALPAAYSIPPLRIKEHKWLGVAADALAAHVYPAVLALIAVHHLTGRPVSVLMIASLLVWSAAVGVRGIISHQLHTSDRDRLGGLQTVVHDFGREKTEWFVVRVLLPMEISGFAAALLACGGGAVLWSCVLLFLAYEVFKTWHGGFRATAFRPEGQPYIPLVDETAYKAWGPVVFAIDAARFDPLFLVALPLYSVLFRSHLQAEARNVRAVVLALSSHLGGQRGGQ